MGVRFYHSSFSSGNICRTHLRSVTICNGFVPIKQFIRTYSKIVFWMSEDRKVYFLKKVFISSAVELQLEMMRCGTDYLSLLWLFFAYAFYGMLDLANEEINLQ